MGDAAADGGAALVAPPSSFTEVAAVGGFTAKLAFDFRDVMAAQALLSNRE